MYMIDERQVALARMTSPEAAEALAGAKVVLIPVGATEQHGPNMTLETDTAVAYQLALRTAAALHPRAVVSPPLPYGVSYHHMGFPGTMTLSPETFQAVVLEVVESLRQHGGTLLHHRRSRRQPGRARRADDEATVSDGGTRSLPLLLHHRG